jgi:hypothetical protein
MQIIKKYYKRSKFEEDESWMIQLEFQTGL